MMLSTKSTDTTKQIRIDETVRRHGIGADSDANSHDSPRDTDDEFEDEEHDDLLERCERLCFTPTYPASSSSSPQPPPPPKTCTSYLDEWERLRGSSLSSSSTCVFASMQPSTNAQAKRLLRNESYMQQFSAHPDDVRVLSRVMRVWNGFLDLEPQFRDSVRLHMNILGRDVRTYHDCIHVTMMLYLFNVLCVLVKPSVSDRDFFEAKRCVALVKECKTRVSRTSSMSSSSSSFSFTKPFVASGNNVATAAATSTTTTSKDSDWVLNPRFLDVLLSIVFVVLQHHDIAWHSDSALDARVHQPLSWDRHVFRWVTSSSTPLPSDATDVDCDDRDEFKHPHVRSHILIRMQTVCNEHGAWINDLLSLCGLQPNQVALVCSELRLKHVPVADEIQTCLVKAHKLMASRSRTMALELARSCKFSESIPWWSDTKRHVALLETLCEPVESVRENVDAMHTKVRSILSLSNSNAGSDASVTNTAVAAATTECDFPSSWKLLQCSRELKLRTLQRIVDSELIYVYKTLRFVLSYPF